MFCVQRTERSKVSWKHISYPLFIYSQNSTFRPPANMDLTRTSQHKTKKSIHPTNTNMQIPSNTEQDQFEQLRIADFEYSDSHSSSDISVVITKRSEMRTMEIDEIIYLLMISKNQRRRSTAPANVPSSSANSNLLLPHPELPPPSRYARRRAAGPRSITN